MTLNNIKDHDHDLQRVAKKTYSLGWYAIKRECQDPLCDYWVTEWKDATQSNIGSFG
jgi:hypothetical protein